MLKTDTFAVAGPRWLPALILVLAATATVAAPVAVIDDTGTRVELREPARRVISLSPHAAELLFAAGAGRELVGVTAYSDTPAAARKINRVGSAGHLDMERILSLRPDLIVAWHSGNSMKDMQTIRRLGIPVFYSEPRRLADIPRNIERLGVLTGHRRAAAQRADRFRRQLGFLQKKFEPAGVISVFYQLWSDPLMTVNGDHIISDVIELCGGRNVFADARGLTPVLSHEAVVAAAPEVIMATHGKRHQLVSNWRAMPEVPAVANNAVYIVPADLLDRQGPRLIQGAEQVCAKLQHARSGSGRKRQ